jgi:hypothetical protein
MCDGCGEHGSRPPRRARNDDAERQASVVREDRRLAHRAKSSNAAATEGAICEDSWMRPGGQG